MSDHPRDSGTNGPAHRHVEMGTALFLGLIGAVAILGSLQVGIGWGVEGPKAGFFPFWVGLLIVAASAVNLVRAWMSRSDKLFAEWGQLRQVTKVVAPTAIYVAAVPWLGIYLASALLMAGFMRWVGRYGWLQILLVSVAVPVISYVTFEKWFLVPLPKGPIEDLLGL